MYWFREEKESIKITLFLILHDMYRNFMSVFVNLVQVKLSVSESPEPPRKPSVQISKGQVHLAWENRSPGTSPIIGYYIQARSMGKYCFRVVCFLH